MFKLKLYITVLFVFFCVFAKAQKSGSNLRTKYISTTQSPVILDTFSIIPNTVTVSDISTGAYNIDYVNALLIWKTKNLPDSLVISYRVFPYKLNGKAYRINYDSIRYNFAAEQPVIIRNSRTERLLDLGNLNYNGSFGRGISFGNNQDAVVNSTLNLQLNGWIGDSMQFAAAISDQNIPVQPQGNTQQLNEFDRIFMQIKKGGWRAEFGDIDIRQDSNYFLRFYKRLQGASFYSQNKLGSIVDNSLLVSGAIAKGKFARNIIEPAEGNQGPYKLYTPNNDLYFAVLAGTEKVFINGELLTRGDDMDYVIDYNTAEIVFSVKRLITRESRIQVEFEYSDRNFLNSMIYGSNSTNFNNKLKINVSAYANTDAKNSPVHQTLSAGQKQFLSGIGNDIDRAYYPSAYLDTFSFNKILYAKRDTIFNGLHDSVYVYSTDSTEALYSVSFTNTGKGKGNYMPSATHANGRVFEWVMPVNGLPQGSWEPVLFLITPKKHQLLSVSADYLLSQNSQIEVEVAMSDYDINTFSRLGNKNNKGFAGKLSYSLEKALSSALKKDLKIETNVSYEITEENFRPVETLRSVEFYRDWGLPLFAPPSTEQIIFANIHLSNANNNYFNYSFSTLHRQNGYSGYKNSIENDWHLGRWSLKNRMSVTTNKSITQKGVFFRPATELSRNFSDFTVGTAYSMEKNEQRNMATDSLLPLSMGYSRWQVFIRSADKAVNKWGVSYFRREDELPEGEKLLVSNRSNNLNAFLELVNNDEQRIRVNATYREVNVVQKFAPNQNNDQTLLGRIEYDVIKWDGFLTANALYETGAGQEQKREYTYVEVPAGQGFYTWIDYNKDGIPQQNEFEIAVFEDQKRWVKIFTPTNEYIKANNVQFNYHIGLRPAALLKLSTNPLGKFLSRIGATSSLQINKKSASRGYFEFNPFTKTLTDTSLISLQSFLSNSLFFNRSGTIWGIDFTHKVHQNKVLLNYGVESNSRREFSSKIRWNVSRNIATSINNRLIRSSLESPGFSNRNYSVKESEVVPAISYIYKTELRASLIYTYNQKNNTTGRKESSVQNSLSTELKYNVLSSGSINGRFTYNEIAFNGEANSTIGYLLLDGLLPGPNFLWNLEFTKRIAGNIELNLQYEGRNAGSTKTIHTGRAGLRAIL